MKNTLTTLALTLAVTGAGAASLPGLTFSITTDQDYYSPPPFGPYGYVTVNSSPAVGMYGFQSEWEAARSEFNLAGATTSSSVLLSFNVLSIYSSGQPLAPFSIGGFTYVGDNQARLSDYTPAVRTGSLDSFALTAASVGLVKTYDVTAAYNAAIARGDLAFGIGLDQRNTPDQFARLGGFTLTTGAAVSAVPEPEVATLMLVGLSALVLARRFKARRPD